ncbi:HPP family-domain-containing protein [Dichotomocladium elegans]|nr:HPP family-domain-containing protein [Dichotomocladium elegans]
MPGNLPNFPPWILRFLGIRRKPVKPLSTWRTCLWAFLGSFTGMSIVMILFHYAPFFARRNIPLIISTWGASVMLLFATPEAPLAQPRGVLFGTVISSIIGVAINKMFLEINTPASIFVEVQWVSAATTISLTAMAMILTRTVHPPAGATALLPIAQPAVADLGWYYVGVMVLAVSLMIAWALIINNIERRFPVYWWKPTEDPQPDPKEAPDTAKRPSTLSAPCSRVPMSLASTLRHFSEPNPFPVDQARCPQITIPQLSHIPSGVLNAQEEAILRQIYQKLQLGDPFAHSLRSDPNYPDVNIANIR